jgi:predicted N-acyltransferase
VAGNYCTRVFAEPHALGAAWDALLPDAPGSLFLQRRFMAALHDSGAASAATGWQPELIALEQAGEVAAAALTYRKFHSYGEYVFDWAWAEAYERHGLPYYPKSLCAVPFTPVPGPRLLARDDSARLALAQGLVAHARGSGLPSLHVLFTDEADTAALAQAGCLVRQGVQFHWFNRGYRDFGDYLEALAQPKRKKIRAERRKVEAAGVECEVVTGPELLEADWAFFHRCYTRTYAARGTRPYLNLDFFLRLARALPEALVMVRARRAGRPIAASLAFTDKSRLYGRYWGALEAVDCLHFEVSYYALIEHAIRTGLAVFEGGAQGEHKLARGFEPVATHSAHWLAHPEFYAAVERYLARERAGATEYFEELAERSALRARPTSD